MPVHASRAAIKIIMEQTLFNMKEQIFMNETPIWQIDPCKGRYSLLFPNTGIAIRSASIRCVIESDDGRLTLCTPEEFAVTGLTSGNGFFRGCGAKMSGSVKGIDIRLSLVMPDLLNGLVLSMEITNRRDTPIRLQRMDPLYSDPDCGGGLFLPGNHSEYTFFNHSGNGATSIMKKVPSFNDSQRDMWGPRNNVYWEFPDDVIWDEPNWHIGQEAGGIYAQDGCTGLYAGFFTPCNAFGELGIKVPSISRLETAIYLSSLMDGILVDPGETRQGESVLLLSCPIDQAAAAWVQAAAMTFAPRKRFHPVTGWCSWYQFGSDLTESHVLEAMEGCLDIAGQSGSDLIQLDDGFERTAGEWDENARFPHGMRHMREQIEKAGFMPGIWLAPTMLNETSYLWRERPELCQRNAEGQSPVHFGNWNGRTHALDSTHPDALLFAEGVVRKAVHDWGYRYLKIDFCYNVSHKARFHNPKLTQMQANRLLYAAIRRAAGEDVYILACGYQGSARHLNDLADAARIGGDQQANWPSVAETMPGNMTRSQVHGHWWTADPDVFYLRNEKNSLSLEEMRLVASITAMMGGLTLHSDLPGRQWDSVSRDMYARICPVCPDGAVVYNLASPASPEIYFSRHANSSGEWLTVATINWTDQEKTIDIPYRQLGIQWKSDVPCRQLGTEWKSDIRCMPEDAPQSSDAGLFVHVHEFWENRYYGRTCGHFESVGQAPHTIRLWNLRSEKAGMHLAASSFHWSGGAVELEEVFCMPDRMSLRLLPNTNSGDLFIASEKKPVVLSPVDLSWEMAEETDNIWRFSMSGLKRTVPIHLSLIGV